MQLETNKRVYTVDEYIQHELKSAVRSEFVNGQLFEMSGEKDINNEIALRLAFLLVQLLGEKGYKIFAHDVKVKIYGEEKYYYPDVFVTRESRHENNHYIKSAPEIIVEVVSETSQVHDYVDKYIAYTKIPSLRYYIIIEPETVLLTCYARGENNEWTTAKYTRAHETVNLDQLEVSFPLRQVYG